MKKYISPILSIILGALTFGMYGAPFLTISTAFGSTSSNSAYAAISFDTENASLTAFSVFSIILLVLAGCLVISGIFMILQNSKVIKSKSIVKLNTVLLWATTLIATAAMICYVVFYSKGEFTVFGYTLAETKIGVTAIVNAAAALLFTVIDFFTSKACKSSTSKKKKK